MKGSIVKRPRAKGRPSYAAVFRTPEGKQVWKSFSREKDAERYLSEHVRAVQTRTFINVRPILMSELLTRYLAHVDVQRKLGLLRPSTAAVYHSTVRAHLLSPFGALRSDQLTRQHVSAWVANLADSIDEGDLAPKTFNNVLGLFKTILLWARREHFLSHDPLDGIKMLKKRKVERRYLEPAQIDALVAAATHHPPDDTIIRLFTYSGLRRGELFSLRWDDIDWGQGEGGQIAVRRSSYRGQVTEPKTEAGARRVDIPQFVLDDLQTYRMMYPPQPGNLLFRKDSGAALNPDDWYRERFLPIVEEAGVGHIGIHGLRHSYCSILVSQNENIKYISRQLGHASVQITSDLYAHLFKETSTNAMARLQQRVLSRQPVSQEP